MGLKLLQTRPGREIGPIYPLSSGPDGGPDKGLKSRPEMPVLSGPFYPVPKKTFRKCLLFENFAPHQHLRNVFNPNISLHF